MALDNTYKLKEGINIDKINWNMLSKNPNAISLLKANPDKIDYQGLSNNENPLIFGYYEINSNVKNVKELVFNKNNDIVIFAKELELLIPNIKEVGWHLKKVVLPNNKYYIEEKNQDN